MDYQTLALTHFFNEEPTDTPAMTSEGLKEYDRRPFASDSWIFAGTENSADDIIEDTFDSIESGLTDLEHTVEVMKRCKAAVPLSYGDIGAVAIAKKFKESERSEPGRDAACQKPQKMGQLTRQIWEDCSCTGGQVRIPQLTAVGACVIPSQYRVEEIAKYANISLREADWISKMYRYIGVDFKMAVKLNKLIRNRTCRLPWDIQINRQGLTLKQLARELKAIQEADQDAPDWMHYDDGIFNLKIMDDMAAHEIDELDLAEEIDDPNQVGEYTYWNQSVIREDDALKNQRTNKLYLKIRNAILAKKVAAGNIPKLNKWIRRLTPAQKTSIRRAVRQAYGQAA